MTITYSVGEEFRIGYSPTPSTDLANLRAIGGRSFVLLDGTEDDWTGSLGELVRVGHIYDNISTTYHGHALVRYGPILERLAGKIVLTAIGYIAIVERTFSAMAGDYANLVTYGVYPVAHPENVDMTDTTWMERDASADVVWASPGGLLGVDLGPQCGSFTLDNTGSTGFGFGSPLLKSFTCTAAIEAALLDNVEPLLQIRPEYARIAGHQAYIRLSDPASVSDDAELRDHASLYVLAVDRVGFYGPDPADPSRPHMARWLHPSLIGAEIDARVAQPGSAGSWVKTFLVNNDTDIEALRQCVISPGPHAGSFKQPARPTPKRRKRIQVLPNATDQGAATGTVELRADDAGDPTADYTFWFRRKGASDFDQLLTDASATTAGYADSSTVWQLDGDDAFVIDANGWTSAAAEEGDVWACSVYHDTRVDPELALAPDLYEIAPFLDQWTEDADRSQADEAKAVTLSKADVQQLWDAPDNGGTSGHGRIRIRDVSADFYDAGLGGWLFSDDEVSPDAPAPQYLVIASVTAASSGGGGDQLEFTTAIANVGDYDENCFFCTGVYHGRLLKAFRGRTASAYSSLATYVDLAAETVRDGGDAEENTPTSGFFTILQRPDPAVTPDPTAGQNDYLQFERTPGSARLTLKPNGTTLGHAYREGAIVIFDTTGFHSPHFTRLKPPTGTARNRYLTRERRVGPIPY